MGSQVSSGTWALAVGSQVSSGTWARAVGLHVYSSERFAFSMKGYLIFGEGAKLSFLYVDDKIQTVLIRDDLFAKLHNTIEDLSSATLCIQILGI